MPYELRVGKDGYYVVNTDTKKRKNKHGMSKSKARATVINGCWSPKVSTRANQSTQLGATFRQVSSPTNPEEQRPIEFMKIMA